VALLVFPADWNPVATPPWQDVKFVPFCIIFVLPSDWWIPATPPLTGCIDFLLQYEFGPSPSDCESLPTATLDRCKLDSFWHYFVLFSSWNCWIPCQPQLTDVSLDFSSLWHYYFPSHADLWNPCKPPALTARSWFLLAYLYFLADCESLQTSPWQRVIWFLLGIYLSLPSWLWILQPHLEQVVSWFPFWGIICPPADWGESPPATPPWQVCKFDSFLALVCPVQLTVEYPCNHNLWRIVSVSLLPIICPSSTQELDYDSLQPPRLDE